MPHVFSFFFFLLSLRFILCRHTNNTPSRYGNEYWKFYSLLHNDDGDDSDDDNDSISISTDCEIGVECLVLTAIEQNNKEIKIMKITFIEFSWLWTATFAYAMFKWFVFLSCCGKRRRKKETKSSSFVATTHSFSAHSHGNRCTFLCFRFSRTAIWRTRNVRCYRISIINTRIHWHLCRRCERTNAATKSIE